MTKADKLLKRFKNKPKDFTYEELVQVLKIFGYTEFTTGKTTGSAKKFKNDKNDLINFHKPHLGNIIKSYVINQIIEKLERNGLI
ncbi:type II toxin-antitoxin system HicA family toxin [bacterium]|nr:type II toxin-antitoxin system HicA family toxin [bacterium]